MPADTGTNERHLRNASIIDQDRINRFPVCIVGVGAIGSHLAEILAKLGVQEFTLIDFDEVDTVNLGVQGFYEQEVGLSKVDAVSHRLQSICKNVEVTENTSEYAPGLVPSQSVVFSCVDSMKTRRQIFRHFCEKDWSVLFDGRMAAESLRVFCVERDPEFLSICRDSLFPEHESYREACTARATIYSAMMAAGILCAQFKKWAMRQMPEPHIHFDLFGMDLFR